MWTTLVICLFLATYLHAESIASSGSASSISTPTTTESSGLASDANSTTSSSTPFNIDEELAKIATSCMSSRNYEQLSGNVVRQTLARGLAATSIGHSIATIGLMELRAALKFAQIGPWKHYNDTDPSEDELASAPTIEAYYDLVEPRSSMRSLDSYFLFEHNVASAVAFLDNRYPSIRTIFKHEFEEIRRSEIVVLDRKAIDHMIVEYSAIYQRVRDAIHQMQRRDNECWDNVD